jgi:hypothetical protein
LLVVVPLTGPIVLSAVDFDCKTDCRTVKINDVFADRMLTAETQAFELPELQHIPKLPFGSCRIAAQTARARGYLLRS